MLRVTLVCMGSKRIRPPIGQAIYDARTRAGLSQQELADLVGRSRETVGNWEWGRAAPDGSTARLEDVLNVTLREQVDLDVPEAYTIDEALNRLREAERQIDRARVILRVVSDQMS